VGNGKIRVYPGNYEDYLRAKPVETTSIPTKPRREKKATRRGAGRRSKTSKNEARRLGEELERIEESIDEMETAIASLEARMSVPGFYDDAATATEIVETHQNLKNRLEKLYEEWGELSENR
jgi:ATPase subunit of ABC transporter with duplicated ATPase domains